jgi:hypothetical protein
MHFAPLTVKSEENKVKLDKFYASIKSRLIVAEVIAGIRAGTQARGLDTTRFLKDFNNFYTKSSV